MHLLWSWKLWMRCDIQCLGTYKVLSHCWRSNKHLQVPNDKQQLMSLFWGMFSFASFEFSIRKRWLQHAKNWFQHATNCWCSYFNCQTVSSQCSYFDLEMVQEFPIHEQPHHDLLSILHDLFHNNINIFYVSKFPRYMYLA